MWPRNFWPSSGPGTAASLTSDEHFSVDGTLLEAWASAKSFPPKKARRGRLRMIQAIQP
jgi:hypothetical protein